MITKLTRVLMLEPIGDAVNKAVKPYAPQPWFADGFVLIVILNSLVALPPSWVGSIKHLDSWTLTMAMAALGLSTHLSELKSVDWKPLMLGATLFLHLMVTGLIVTLLATTWL